MSGRVAAWCGRACWVRARVGNGFWPRCCRTTQAFLFKNCTPALVTIDLSGYKPDGEGIARIGQNAIGYAERLTTVAIPNTVTYIGYGAFQGCSSLESVEFPYFSVDINSAAFPSCLGFGLPTGTPLDPRGKTIECVPCFNRDVVHIPKTVIAIGNYAFAQCVHSLHRSLAVDFRTDPGTSAPDARD